VNAWKAAKAARVLRALHRIGWTNKRQTGSHRVLAREGWSDYVFAFHDSEEIGPRMLARVAKHTGSSPKTYETLFFPSHEVAATG
jgi:predicted RNA binding protein YcfA (HicA-like mRNA interferase family)